VGHENITQEDTSNSYKYGWLTDGYNGKLLSGGGNTTPDIDTSLFSWVKIKSVSPLPAPPSGVDSTNSFNSKIESSSNSNYNNSSCSKRYYQIDDKDKYKGQESIETISPVSNNYSTENNQTNKSNQTLENNQTNHNFQANKSHQLKDIYHNLPIRRSLHIYNPFGHDCMHTFRSTTNNTTNNNTNNTNNYDGSDNNSDNTRMIEVGSLDNSPVNNEIEQENDETIIEYNEEELKYDKKLLIYTANCTTTQESIATTSSSITSPIITQSISI
jgi:hypothetical protein